MQNSCKTAFQKPLFLQLYQFIYISREIRLQLGRRHKVHQDLTCKGGLAYQQMSEIACVTQSMVKRELRLAEILQGGLQDQGKIGIRDPAAVDRDDIIKPAPLMHAQGKRTILVFIPEGILHLVAVFIFLRAGPDSLDPFGDGQLLCRNSAKLCCLVHCTLQKAHYLAAL